MRIPDYIRGLTPESAAAAVKRMGWTPICLDLKTGYVMSMREGDAYDRPDSFITHQVTHFAGDDAAHLHHGHYDLGSVSAYRNFRERTGRSNDSLELVCDNMTGPRSQWLYIAE